MFETPSGGSCDQFLCKASNESAPCLSNPLPAPEVAMNTSTVSFWSQVGFDYYVLVSGFRNDTGSFVLKVKTASVPSTTTTTMATPTATLPSANGEEVEFLLAEESRIRTAILESMSTASYETIAADASVSKEKAGYASNLFAQILDDARLAADLPRGIAEAEAAEAILDRRAAERAASMPVAPSGASYPNIGFLGRGYNIFIANPRETTGKVDPGFTQPVIRQSFELGRFSGDGAFPLPDYADVTEEASSTFTSHSTSYASEQAYKDTLDMAVSIGASVSADTMFNGRFSASASYQHIREETARSKSKYVQIDSSTVYYRARLRPSFELDGVFVAAVLGLPVCETEVSTCPTAATLQCSPEDNLAYSHFLETYGTHFSTMAVMGGVASQRYAMTQSEYASFQQTVIGAALSTSVEANFEFLSASSSVDVSAQLQTEARSTLATMSASSLEWYLGGQPVASADIADGNTESLKIWSTTVRENPVPLVIQVDEISTLFSNPELFFGPDVNSTAADDLITRACQLSQYYCKYSNGTYCPPDAVNPNEETDIRCLDYVTFEWLGDDGVQDSTVFMHASESTGVIELIRDSNVSFLSTRASTGAYFFDAGANRAAVIFFDGTIVWTCSPTVPVALSPFQGQATCRAERLNEVMTKAPFPFSDGPDAFIPFSPDPSKSSGPIPFMAGRGGTRRLPLHMSRFLFIKSLADSGINELVAVTVICSLEAHSSALPSLRCSPEPTQRDGYSFALLSGLLTAPAEILTADWLEQRPLLFQKQGDWIAIWNDTVYINGNSTVESAFDYIGGLASFAEHVMFGSNGELILVGENEAYLLERWNASFANATSLLDLGSTPRMSLLSSASAYTTLSAHKVDTTNSVSFDSAEMKKYVFRLVCADALDNQGAAFMGSKGLFYLAGINDAVYFDMEAVVFITSPPVPANPEDEAAVIHPVLFYITDSLNATFNNPFLQPYLPINHDYEIISSQGSNIGMSFYAQAHPLCLGPSDANLAVIDRASVLDIPIENQAKIGQCRYRLRRLTPGQVNSKESDLPW